MGQRAGSASRSRTPRPSTCWRQVRCRSPHRPPPTVCSASHRGGHGGAQRPARRLPWALPRHRAHARPLIGQPRQQTEARTCRPPGSWDRSKGSSPTGWDHLVASDGTTRRVAPVVLIAFLLGCHQVVGLGSRGRSQDRLPACRGGGGSRAGARRRDRQLIDELVSQVADAARPVRGYMAANGKQGQPRSPNSRCPRFEGNPGPNLDILGWSISDDAYTDAAPVVSI